MKSKHAKSPCCRGRVRRYGPRRRQCVCCGRTWTVRPRKRGRHAHRMSRSVLHRVLVEGFTLVQLFSRHSPVELPAFRYRFREALRRFATRATPQMIPSGPLVLLADGMWFEFRGKPWVLYLTALKSCDGNYATFLDPMIFPGNEHVSHWHRAFAAIPEDALKRVRALVVDHLPGMRLLAAQRGWILQLCQFHLMLKLQAHRRRIRHTVPGVAAREEIQQLIRYALEITDGHRLTRTITRLRQLSEHDCGRRIPATVREFLKRLPLYRSNLDHPELGLPRTTNSVESMGRIIRELFRSSRAGSSPRAVLLWATARIRMRPTVTCNGHSINRKN